MERYDTQSAADPATLASKARDAFTGPAREDHGHGPDDQAASVREVDYRGHTIRIETTYRITVDGAPVTGHVMVNNEGRVHYHSIPNQEFASAVDMVKRVIDLMPDDAPITPPTDQPQPEHQHY